MSEMSRIVLRSGDEVFTSRSVDNIVTSLAERDAVGQTWFRVLLVPMDEEAMAEPVREAYVRIGAVDLVEAVDERELEAHRRDREEWIEHGDG